MADPVAASLVKRGLAVYTSPQGGDPVDIHTLRSAEEASLGAQLLQLTWTTGDSVWLVAEHELYHPI